MTMTSVAGHVYCNDFPEEYGNWRACPPESLFDARIVEEVSKEAKEIVHNLNLEAKNAAFLVIWTDCDREGEYIGWEIGQICRQSNRQLQVFRARYSTVTEREVRQALNNLLPLDQRQVNAVALRMELDLRGGAALTRFLTLFLQQKFGQLDKKVISYGSCQFPTLGFVVEQYLRRVKFISEPFYFLQLTVKKDSVSVDSCWSRNRLFDLLSTMVLYKIALRQSNNGARVVSFTSKSTQKYKPLPLTTVELQKFASNFFKIPSHRTMKVAEDLYNRGLISYPRTETDSFDDSFNFYESLSIQTTHPEWGLHASRILDRISKPRKGKRNDKAHPPIHPTGPGIELVGDEKKIYEFIVRRFLACCSDDAKGFEKIVQFEISTEQFKSKGLSVVERNYLDVYPYDKWQSNQIPDFFIGELVQIEGFTLQEGKTTAPNLLTEAQLISTMDKNGIGTDATIHEHIKKIQEREYARKTSDHRFEPTPLGLGLVCGHDEICKDQRSLSKPFLRATMEQHIKLVESGQKTRKESTSFLLSSFIQIFNQIVGEKERLLELFSEHFTNGIISTINDTNTNTTAQPKTRKKRTVVQSNNNNSEVQSNRRSNISNSSSIDNPTEFICNCNLPAIQKSTSKYGTPRFFFKCSLPNGCNYFKWKDDQTDNSNNSSNNNTINNNSNINTSTSTPSDKCNCGLRPTKRQSKTTKNADRYFLSCPKQINRCKYFCWID